MRPTDLTGYALVASGAGILLVVLAIVTVTR